MPSTRYGPADGDPEGPPTPPYGSAPVPGPAEYGPRGPSYGSPPPPRRPNRGGRIAVVMLGVLLLALAVGSFLALREGTPPRVPPDPAPTAAPSTAAAPAGDEPPPPTEVPVDAAPAGQIGPGIYRVGTGAGQMAAGDWISDGRSLPELACYVEAFARGENDETIGSPVRMPVREEEGGRIRISVPDRAFFVATTSCLPWRRP